MPGEITKEDSPMIVPKHYENMRVLHENTMPLRSYYVPASRRMDDLVHNRESSDRICFLDQGILIEDASMHENTYSMREDFSTGFLLEDPEYETPDYLIDELKGMEKLIYKKVFAGSFAKKIYRLYEYKSE